jgi:cell division protein FtsB
MSERARRWMWRAGLLLLWTGTAYYLVLGGQYNVFDVSEMEAARAASTTRVDRLSVRLDSLVHRGDSLESVPAAIERVAREEYGLLRDGEILVRFVRPAAPERELDE